MAIPQVAITGKVLTPDGVGATGGTITAALSFPGTVRDSTGNVDQRVGGTQKFAIGIDGSVTGLTLVPNDAITPAGSFYVVTYELANGLRWTEFWQLVTGTPLEIGDVPLIGAQPVGLELSIPSRPTEPTAGGAIRGHLYLIPGAAGEEDRLVVILKGWDNVYRSKTFVLGGGPD
jgi:hypothetical protein